MPAYSMVSTNKCGVYKAKVGKCLRSTMMTNQSTKGEIRLGQAKIAATYTGAKDAGSVRSSCRTQMAKPLQGLLCCFDKQNFVRDEKFR